jgi:putative membrane protein
MKSHKIIWQTAITALALMSAAPLGAAEHRDTDTKETTKDRGQFTARDYRFVTEAARGGMMEVRLGELAKQKGGSQAVRDFGQRMVADHLKANDELKQIVSSKGATLPSDLTHHENAMIEKFEKLSGADFDKDYASAMVKDHKKDLKEFQDAAKDCTDPELKSFAQKTAGIIEEHLRIAQSLVPGTQPTGR